MSTDKYQAFASGLYQGVPVVTQYMRERVIPLLEGLVNPPERDIRLRALYLRAYCWMQSLEKLINPQDFQTVATCNRALYELTVDLILLAEGGPLYAPELMYWWEQSAKLKAAEALVRYFNRIGQPIPSTYDAQIDFISRKKDIVRQQRQALWGQAKHPSRWTGSNDLSVDVEKADTLRQNEISQDLDSSLLQFYETDMRRIHTTVHGSGLANERYLSREGFYVVSGLGYKWSTDLSMFCTKLILDDFGFSAHLPQLRDEWNRIKEERLLLYDQFGPLSLQDMGDNEELENEQSANESN